MFDYNFIYDTIKGVAFKSSPLLPWFVYMLKKMLICHFFLSILLFINYNTKLPVTLNIQSPKENIKLRV